jgi:hypothetical protein
MNFDKCLRSTIIPSHNEWINIILFLAFAIYFWIVCILLLFKKGFEFNNEVDYVLLFIASLGIALSLTMTAVYLTFYPISSTMKARLETFNLMGILVMGYALVFVFVASEWA